MGSSWTVISAIILLFVTISIIDSQKPPGAGGPKGKALYKGRTRRQAPGSQGGVCVQPIDLVFAFDASGSVEDSGFEQIKQFAKEIVSGFEIGPDKTHIGILTFSEYGESHVKLSETFERDELLEKINGIPYHGYRTATDDALRVADKEMFSLEGGVRQGVPQVLILLTDGKCTVCKESVEEAVRPLKERGVNIYTIGVTDNVNRTELEIISSRPLEDHMFEIDSFDQLKSLVINLQKKSCQVKNGKCPKPLGPFTCNPRDEDTCYGDEQCIGPQKCCNDGCFNKCRYPLLNCLTSVDIAFALDSSNSVLQETFNRMKEFANEIVDSFAISQHEARFATLSYSENAQVGFNFKRYDSTEDIKRAISRLPHVRGNTRVDKALELAKSDIFSLQGAVRTRRPMVLIVFFDGDVSRDMRDLAEVAEPLKAYGVKVVAIGVGPEINDYQLNKVASSASSIFKGESFRDVLPELYSIAKEACTEKSGTCRVEGKPVDEKECVGVKHECDDDFDCFGNAKCCKQGCQRTCTLPENVCRRKVDIAFALHQNLNEYDFKRAKDFMKSSINHFNIGANQSHAAVMSFGQKTEIVFDFNAGQGFKNDVIKKVDDLEYNRGKGRISDVLALSCDAIFCVAGGSRDTVPKMLILITSESNPSPDAELNRRLNILRSRGVDVIVLGIGDVDTQMLQRLTNENPEVEDRVLLTKYASGLLQYSQDIADFACGEAGTSLPPSGGVNVGGPSALTGFYRINDDGPQEKDALQDVDVQFQEGGCNQPKTCLKGPKGSHGRPGAIGPNGEPGPTGLLGPKGISGPKGTKGPDGRMGPKGRRGPDGIQGLPGYPGYHGIPGQQGVEGRRGNDGDCGLPGKSGTGGRPGLDGFDGSPGRPGSPGVKGGKGLPAVIDPNLEIAPGDDGDPGSNGNPGFRGPNGYDGSFGDREKGTSQDVDVKYQGDDGTDGTRGTDGTKGDMGDLGTYINVKGDKGPRGERGPPGPKPVSGGSINGTEGLQGETGKPGDAGETGEPGKKGPDAEEVGLKGRQGTQGENGERGPEGERGLKGDRGDIGSKGQLGPKGDAGDRGRPGISGQVGLKGEDGSAGADGRKGDQGEDGQGLAGPDGTSGEGGMKGLPGRQGSIGLQGAAGPKGLQGGIQVGPRGDPGSVGRRGDRGKDGMDGEPGMQGVVGPKGTTGEPGARGDQGRNAELREGKPGMDGPPGEGGPRGPIGDIGPMGPKGPDHVIKCAEPPCPRPRGKKGEPGAPGDSGETGGSGQSGPQGPKGHPGGPCPTCPTGDQGKSGEIGEPGTPGQLGETGIQGDRGLEGDQGRDGEDGPQGAAGEKGEPGPVGDIGAQGDIGSPAPGIAVAKKGESGLAGEAGLDGARGPKGITGSKGRIGNAGADGPRGKQGPKGEIGFTGPVGKDGFPGVAGEKGQPGERMEGEKGFQGVTGRDGAQGNAGEIGIEGIKGEPGTEPTEEDMTAMKEKMQGDIGARGPQGDIGAQGVAGPTGPVGKRGPKGLTGSQGAKGASALKGDIGPPGRTGPDGDPGEQGFPGRMGLTGESGENGKAGAPGVTPAGDRGDTGPKGFAGDKGPDAPPPIGCINLDVTDIAFLIDNSRSVTEADFEKQKQFMKDILARFEIGPTSTLAGTIRYGNEATISLRFGEYTTSTSLNEAIDNIQYTAATETRLDSALKKAKDDLFDLSNGARDFVNNRKVNKALVVLGDGFISGGGIPSNEHYENSISYAEALRDDGVTIYAVGVGNEINTQLLEKYVTKPSYLLQIDSYQSIIESVGTLRSNLQEQCTSEGDPGRDGDDGDRGAEGPRGAKGQPGDGVPGPKGFKGSKGPDGETIAERGDGGFAGRRGEDGQKGRSGRPGQVVIGTKGSKGQLGETTVGPQGPRGEEGDQGIKGDQGPPGKTLCDLVLETDIVFLMDSSNSVQPDNFEKMKKFVQNIIAKFDIDNQLTRVSVITFDSTAELRIALDDYSTTRDLNRAIDALPYNAGRSTRMDKALVMAKEQAFTAERGARENVRRVVVLMADGLQSYAEDQTSISDAIQPLKDDQVLRYAIGIGPEVSGEDLKVIADKNVVLADNFDELQLKIDDQISLIGRGGCKGDQGVPGKQGKPGPNGFPGFAGEDGPRGPEGERGPNGLKGVKGTQGESQGSGGEGARGDIGDAGPRGLPGCDRNENVPTDLGFMLDASGSLYETGFNKEKEFIKSVIKQVGSVSSDGVRVGVVVYSDEATLSIKFDDHYDQEALERAIDRIPYEQKGTRIDLGMREAQKMFQTENGGRGNSKKVLILLTDGQQSYVPGVADPSLMAKELATDGIDIFSVGIGQEIDKTELESFVSKEEHIFLADDINNLVIDMSAEITQALTCEGGPRGPSGRTGDDGPPGAAGPDGPAGEAGLKGYPGDPGFGPKGDNGDVGQEGRRGPDGDRGYRGTDGTEGIRGPRGPPGYAGPPGLKGERGTQGFIGLNGPNGRQGPKGEKGSSDGIGRRGPRGYPGDRGLPGPQGPRGKLPPGNELKDIEGDRGQQGGVGDIGIPGKPGKLKDTPGPSGRLGSQGEKGEPGNFGDPGEIGERGPDGPQGPRGDIGNTGDVGEDGNTGDLGRPGLRGDAGVDGQSPQGDKGDQGPAGRDGPAGKDGPKGQMGFVGMDGKKGERGDIGLQGRMREPPSRPDPSMKGYKGSAGIDGSYGDKGQKGERVTINGALGSRGERGEVGARGPAGKQGEDGPEGFVGRVGRKGLKGRIGSDGNPGSAGPEGRKGIMGEIIGGGERGERGDDGYEGPRGRPGKKGVTGDNGPLGPPGQQGLQGVKGRRGFPGLQGDQGKDGPLGRAGIDGYNGPRGGIGKPGPPGPPGHAEGFYVVRHSQSDRVPSCPLNYKKLWDGYSLMYTVGNGHAHAQDLGDAGSCSKTFSTLPFLFCSITGSCKYASRNDFVYWLSGDVRQPMMPVSNNAIEPFISRCAVCEAPSVHIAVHSQDTLKPVCPQGFDALWDGFSYMMVAGAGKTGAGQSLSSSGSCLEQFRPKPFIECQGARGTCHFFSDKYSFWLTTIDPTRQFETQNSQTLSATKGDDLESRVSRCKVCMRRLKSKIEGNRPESNSDDANNNNNLAENEDEGGFFPAGRSLLKKFFGA